MFGECLYDGSGMEPTEYHVQMVEAVCGGFECCECGLDIEELATYELVTACYEDEWKVYATCVSCMRVRGSMFRGNFVHGGLWESVHETYGLTRDGVDEDWVPHERRAAGVEVSESYEKALKKKGLDP